MNKQDKQNAVDRLLGRNKNNEGKEAISSQIIEETPSREELEEALKAHANSKRGRPKKWQGSRSSEGEVRTSIVITEEQLAKLKEISLRETITLKEVIIASLDLSIENYEKKFGKIVPKVRTKETAKALFK